MLVSVIECRQCPASKIDYTKMQGHCRLTSKTLFFDEESLSDLDMNCIHESCPLKNETVTLTLAK